MTISDAVRALRAELDESQQAFSNRLGVGIATVQRWESGRWKPSEGSLHQLARIAHSAGKPRIAAAFTSRLSVNFDDVTRQLLADVRDLISTARHSLDARDVGKATWQLAKTERLINKALADLGSANAEVAR
jgi:transcriptional regulator with XRE-family HTH domain